MTFAPVTVLMANLLDLGRSQQCDQLAQEAAERRAAADWTASAALELACAWLLAGDLLQADLAYLEADQLDPSLSLVPDVWGLWPVPEFTTAVSGERETALALAERFRSWRHPDPQSLWQALLPRIKANWRQACEPELADPLLILGRAMASPDAPPLDPPLEQELAGLVADVDIAAEPAASNRYWQLVASIRPHWDLARIRAADLALARGELELSAHWLSDPPAEALANPWFHDVVARHAVVRGAVDAALDAWQEAIHAATALGDQTAMAQIFEQRLREARRGPGVLQVRSLVNRGELEAAQSLLERLLADDPQWQPLLSLREQLRSAAQSESSLSPEAASQSGTFEQLLDRAANRLAQLGLAVEKPGIDLSTVPVHDALLAELDALSRRFSDYEARFALA